MTTQDPPEEITVWLKDYRTRLAIRERLLLCWLGDPTVPVNKKEDLAKLMAGFRSLPPEMLENQIRLETASSEEERNVHREKLKVWMKAMDEALQRLDAFLVE